MTISPAPRFPERAPQVYERKGADNATRGTMNDYSAAQIETVARSGGRTQRQSPTVVND